MEENKTELRKQYGHKIVHASDIAERYPFEKRDEVIVMCHGTFDLVHPGHIRHLLYAKDKGDLLVVSLTCDAHVTKANYRPYVPEELRAINLAALELVDFVVVDHNPTPLELLESVRPNIFVKGYEYISDGLHPRTADEKEIIESYGGELIFTPGDIVYSSSAIITAQPPDLADDKLASLMEGEDVGFGDLYGALDQMASLNVHVIGDTIVDSITRCEMIGANGKTPTFSVRYESENHFVGGAGIVAKHMVSSGAEVRFTTVLGDDEMAEFVHRDLADSPVDFHPITDKTRPTTNKNAFVARSYRLLKVDTLDNRAISDNILEEFCGQISIHTADAVVFSDFRHGIFNQSTIPILTEAIPDETFKVADSQVASRWGNILEFNGFDLITPNEREARFALADQDTVVRPLGSELYKRANCGVLFLKMGSRGMLVFRRIFDDPEDHRAFFALDPFCDQVVDPVGAGDALLAYGSLAMKATGNAVIAAVLGSMAAGAECERDGNIPITPEIIRAKIDAVQVRLNG
ncbi:MAG TPA: ADP-heptose synthase [Rhodospirillaceae bacterium]|nr:ADP-heptose synthase [Rhodospirillaceae bacterium]HAA93819.1 ADP-heptose synthase [Rhodospirillaceae bacterium]HAT34240.1 ADP-heptose synthase [Rhodospirillaceae bacterium]